MPQPPRPRPLPPLPTSREGWVALLRSALCTESITSVHNSSRQDKNDEKKKEEKEGGESLPTDTSANTTASAQLSSNPRQHTTVQYRSPAHLYPRLAYDGSTVASYGQPSARTAPGGPDALKSRQSAVLMLLTPVEYDADNGSNKPTGEGTVNSGGAAHVPDLFFTLTMRTGQMRSHGSQMAFPGGRSDKVFFEDDKDVSSISPQASSDLPAGSEGSCLINKDNHHKKVKPTSERLTPSSPSSSPSWRWEDPISTAEREALEEVGIPPDRYTVLGTMRPLYSTPSRSWVTPVVAIANEGTPPSRRKDTDGNVKNATEKEKSACVGGSLRVPSVSPFIASPDEVASLHYLSLRRLLDNSDETHHHAVRYYPYGGEAIKDKNRKVIIIDDEKEENTADEPVPRCAHPPRRSIPAPWLGQMAAYVMPCFFAQDLDPFASVRRREHAAGDEDNDSDSHIAAETMAHPTLKGLSLKKNAENEEKDAHSLNNKVLLVARGSEEDARLGPLSLTLIKEQDVEGASLVWGLSAFLLCELMSRITAARVPSVAAWQQHDRTDAANKSALSVPCDNGKSIASPAATAIVDLSPYLSHSHFAVRDPSYLDKPPSFADGYVYLGKASVKYVTGVVRKAVGLA